MLALPPLQLPAGAQAYVRGEVAIHPSAAIAPGVLLQAEPGSQIVIGAGVCIGLGAVLHTYDGILELEQGVSLGAGVLIVGQGKIGAGACIGSSATLYNCSIPRGTIVPAGSLIGDTSRQIAAAPAPAPVQEGETPVDQPRSPAAPATETAPPAAASTPAEASAPANPQVYGQAYLSELLITLLPHRQPLDQSAQELPPPPNNT